MTHASTFSGIGGAEVAAAMLGWENAFHCEINPFGRKVLEYWFPNAESYEDITKTDFSGWRGKIDVLTGGFPCQPFSAAGKRRGNEDDRFLWPHMLRVIEQIRPTWFVGENVHGISTLLLQGRTSKVADEATIFGEGDTYEETRQRYVLDEICDNLESIGYSVQPILVPACSVGAPHIRKRIFIIACDDVCQPRAAENTDGSGRGLGEIQEQTRFGFTRNSCPAGNAGGFGFHDGEVRSDKWEDFPTQPPLCGGDDGIPFDVDRLSIPAKKWRASALAAYGNAIVPQVMYQIFRVIEQTYDNNHQTNPQG